MLQCLLPQQWIVLPRPRITYSHTSVSPTPPPSPPAPPLGSRYSRWRKNGFRMSRRLENTVTCFELDNSSSGSGTDGSPETRASDKVVYPVRDMTIHNSNTQTACSALPVRLSALDSQSRVRSWLSPCVYHLEFLPGSPLSLPPFFPYSLAPSLPLSISRFSSPPPSSRSCSLCFQIVSGE